MLQRERETWKLRWVCALILLTACCFRTAAVWTSPPVSAPRQSFPPLLYTKPEPHAQFRLDAETIRVEDRAGVDADMEALLAAPVELHVSEEPLILIVHTHATEAYSDTEGYRSEDIEQNMVRIGREMAEILNANGIPTLHDTTLHDASGYDAAYERTELAIAAYLEQYPSLCMVIDVHRDAVQDAQGQQKPLTTVLHGQKMAQLLLVMGTDTPELPHPNWETNLSFALKLQAYIAQETPELLRPLMLRAARYNEHMTPYSFLLEVGTAGNTQQEALRSAAYLAQRLSELVKALDTKS